MATYSAIPDANLDPDSPARSIDALALRDNPIAIAEGAAGAPKIENAAFQVVSAANTVICWRDPEVFASSSASYPAAYTGDYDIRVFASGAVRVNCSHYQIGGGTSYLRFLKNGVLDTEWTTTSGTPIARTSDISVSYGDVVSVQQRRVGGTQSVIQDASITANEFFWVNAGAGV